MQKLRRFLLVICIAISCVCVPTPYAQNSKLNDKNVTVKIGTEGAYPPFSYSNIKGEIKGFDVDIGNAMCAIMHYNCVWQVYDTTNLIEALSSGEVQVAIVSKSITPSLTKPITLSTAYYSPNYVLVYHRDNSPPGTSNSDLLNTTLGALKNTTEFDIIKTIYSGSRVKAMPQLETAFYALSRKDIDFLVIDYNVVEPWLAAKGDGRCCVYRPFDQNILSSEYARILMNKDAATIQTAFKNALRELQETGELRKIAARHGLEPGRFLQDSIGSYQ